MRGYPAVACSVVAFVGGVALTLGLEAQARAADGAATVPWYAQGRPVPTELAAARQPGVVAIDYALYFGPHYIADPPLAAMIHAGDVQEGGTYEQRPDGISRDGQPPTALLDGWGSADERWVQTVQVTAPGRPASKITLRVSTERFYFGDGSFVSRTRVEAPHGGWPPTAPRLDRSNVCWEPAGGSAARVALTPAKGARDPYALLVAQNNYVVVQRDSLDSFHYPIGNTSRIERTAGSSGLLTALTTTVVRPRGDLPGTPAAQKLIESGLVRLGETRCVARQGAAGPIHAQFRQCFALTTLPGQQGAWAARPITERLYASLREPPPAEARARLAAAAAGARAKRTTENGSRGHRPR